MYTSDENERKYQNTWENTRKPVKRYEAIGRHTKITMQQLGKDDLWFDSKEALVNMLLKII